VLLELDHFPNFLFDAQLDDAADRGEAIDARGERLRGLEAALRKSSAAKSNAKSAEPKKTSIRRRKP
jgi:hypothetical protein